jgi:lipoyl(octanoyl) transferase
MTKSLLVVDLGLCAYDDAWAYQKRALAARISGELPEDLLILVQHPPVVTLGRRTKPDHLLTSADSLEACGIQVREVERGGDVTIHEPGQLVAYPIVDLKRHKQDLHWYLRQVEESIIRGLDALALASTRLDGLTGVWRVDERGPRKLASIGVHARDWVTWHGVALNVNNTLATFDHTVPCGIDGVTMTTVAREFEGLGLVGPSYGDVQASVVHGFSQVFGLGVVPLATGLPLSDGN